MRVLIIPLIILLLLTASCTYVDQLLESGRTPKCKCPSPSAWSECREIEAIKTRSNYRCGPETDYKCEKYWEKVECARQIIVKGDQGLEIRISPTTDEIVREIIWVEALTVPTSTNEVDFFFYPEGIILSTNMTRKDSERVTKFRDLNSKDGWKMLIDTDTYRNGAYQIAVKPTFQGAPDGTWLDSAYTKVTVDN